MRRKGFKLRKINTEPNYYYTATVVHHCSKISIFLLAFKQTQN